jgi:hypothetical protein
MLRWLKQPLRIRWVVLGALGIVCATALYCLAYNGLTGRSEPLSQALAWSVANILPWWLALEGGKRCKGAAQIILVLAAALSVSLLLGKTTEPSLAFELLRRLPAIVVVSVMLGLGRLLSSEGRPERDQHAAFSLLVPDNIDWISAARNYVELHGGGRTVIARASLASAETQLASRGFVRIHRSLLVRRDAILHIRAEDVLLHDRTSLKLGSKYRARLLQPEDIRPLVPTD